MPGVRCLSARALLAAASPARACLTLHASSAVYGIRVHLRSVCCRDVLVALCTRARLLLSAILLCSACRAMGYPLCELCGKQIKGGRKSADFSGRGGASLGLPSDEHLEKYLPASLELRRAAKRGASGWLHNEAAPRNCYLLCHGVHHQLDKLPERAVAERTRSAGPAAAEPAQRPSLVVRTRKAESEALAEAQASQGAGAGMYQESIPCNASNG